MKALTICLISLFFSISLFAQQQPAIIFKVVGGQNKKIYYTRPTDGQFFPTLIVGDTLDANGELVLTNTEKVAGAYIFHFKKQYRLYVVPGKQYKVTINNEDKENPVTVDAPEQEGQLELLKLAWDYSQNAGMRLYRNDTVYANNKQKVLQSMDSCLKPFEQLYAQHKLSNPFYTYAKACIKNYYATVLAISLTLPVRYAVFHKDSAGYDAVKLKQLDDHWRDLLKLSDITDPASMVTDTYNEYFYFYNGLYLSYFSYQMKGNKIIRDADNEDVKFHNMAQHFTKEPLREYLLASILKMLLLEDRYPKSLPDLYAEFTSQYPHSRYIKYLSDGIEKVKTFYVASKIDFTASQRFVPNQDSINTVDELLSGFKGKTLYIDIWATWCAPCKAEFAFKKELEPFFKSKGVEVLYVSLDRTGAAERWKNMIKYYNLEGYHIIVSEKLAKDINKVFANGKGISIPHYAICKDGKIILADAKAPSEKAVLYKQIESVL